MSSSDDRKITGHRLAPVDELLKEALHDAINWQLSLADAYAHIPKDPIRADALAQAAAYRGILTRRYGPPRSAMDRALANTKTVTLKTLRSRNTSPTTTENDHD